MDLPVSGRAAIGGNRALDKKEIQMRQTAKINCHTIFAMTLDMKRRKLDSGERFFCPNGHGQSYSESTVDRLHKKIQELKETRKYYEDFVNRLMEERDQFKLSAKGQKAAKTRIMNRIKNGVCPCCNRSFDNLHQHMKTKHKELFKEHQNRA